MLFGAASRFVLHKVREVKPGSSDLGVLSGRLSFTMRHAPAVQGREAEFARFVPTQSRPLGPCSTP